MFFQTVTDSDSDLGILVNDNLVCIGDAVSDNWNQGICSAIVELQVGDVVNVKVIYGNAILSHLGKVNGFTGFFTKLSDLYLSETINHLDYIH